jgi:hypothetical protein
MNLLYYLFIKRSKINHRVVGRSMKRTTVRPVCICRTYIDCGSKNCVIYERSMFGHLHEVVLDGSYLDIFYLNHGYNALSKMP